MKENRILSPQPPHEEPNQQYAREAAGAFAPGEAQVTIQHASSDDEEMKTINNEEDSPEKRTYEHKDDSDLHEFSYDGRSFYVRLNQFNNNRIIQGYLKKLCNESSFLFSSCFEMRFCIMDMTEMVFKYAKSPKEEFTIIDMTELVSCSFEDERRTKPIKVKKGKEGDLKYLLHLIGRKRTYVLSAHTRSDQVMWFNGFQVFFKVKHVINLVQNGTAFSAQSLQMLEEARQKKAAIKKNGQKKNSARHLYLKNTQETPALDRPTSTVLLKGKLDATKESTKASNQEAQKRQKSFSTNDHKSREAQKSNRLQPSSVLSDKTKESDPEDQQIDQEQKFEKAQRLLQTNFLKAVMIDDPALREFAITLLQNVQKKVNKHEDLDRVELLLADLPWNEKPADTDQQSKKPSSTTDAANQSNQQKQSLEEVKKQVMAKQQMNETKQELAEVAEQRKKQQLELEQTRKKLEEIQQSKPPAGIADDERLEGAGAQQTEQWEYYGSEQDDSDLERLDESNQSAMAILEKQPVIELKNHTSLRLQHDNKIPTSNLAQSQLKCGQDLQHETTGKSLHQQPPLLDQQRRQNDQFIEDTLGYVQQEAKIEGRQTLSKPSILTNNEGAPMAAKKHEELQVQNNLNSLIKDAQTSREEATELRSQQQNSLQQLESNQEYKSAASGQESEKSHRTTQRQEVHQILVKPNSQQQLTSESQLIYPQQNSKKTSFLQSQAALNQQFASTQQPSASYSNQLLQNINQQQPYPQPKLYYPIQDPPAPSIKLDERKNSEATQNDNRHVNDVPFEIHNDATNEQFNIGFGGYSTKNTHGNILELKPTSQVIGQFKTQPNSKGVAALTNTDFSNSKLQHQLNGQAVADKEGNSSILQQNQQNFSPPQPQVKTEMQVVDMLQSLQTIQIDNDDDDSDAEKRNLSFPPRQDMYPSNQDITNVQKDLLGSIPLENNRNSITKEKLVKKSQNEIDSILASQYERMSQSQVTDELTDSIPAFVLKPFEESKEVVLADGQTEVKAFDDVDDDDSAVVISSECYAVQRQQNPPQSTNRVEDQTHNDDQRAKAVIELKQQKTGVTRQYNPHQSQQVPQVAAEAFDNIKHNEIRRLSAPKQDRQGQLQNQNQLPMAPNLRQKQFKQRQQRLVQTNQQQNVRPEEQKTQSDQSKNLQKMKIAHQEAQQVFTSQQRMTYDNTEKYQQQNSSNQKIDLKQSFSHQIGQNQHNLQGEKDQGKTRAQCAQIEIQRESSMQISQSGSQNDYSTQKDFTNAVSNEATQKQVPKFTDQQPKVSEHCNKPKNNDQTQTQVQQQQFSEHPEKCFSPDIQKSEKKKTSSSPSALLYPHYVITRPGDQTRNEPMGNFYNGPSGVATSFDKQMTQQQVKKKRRLHITRMSNPQENSVLYSSSQANTTQLNCSHVGGVGNEIDQSSGAGVIQDPFKVELSAEYLNARKFFMRSSVAQQQLERSSQRILKVVNIIGHQNANKDGKVSAKRVSSIRARQYKSKGEKVVFRHTGSRENLFNSQDLVRASGFTQMKINELDFPDFHDSAGRNSNMIQTSSTQVVQQRPVMAQNSENANISTHQARKNMKHLVNKKQIQKNAASMNFYPSGDSQNLNRMLNEMDKDGPPPEDHTEKPATNQIEAVNPLVLDNSYISNCEASGTGVGFFSRDSDAPAQLQPGLQQSLNRQKDIFRRTSTSFNTCDAMSPVVGSAGTSPNQSQFQPKTQSFEDVIAQQRDTFVIEKLEQQHRVSIHRKNSASRASIESQRRSQREESIKAKRAARKQKQLSLHQGLQQQNDKIIGGISGAPLPTQNAFQRGRTMTKQLRHQQQQKINRQKFMDLDTSAKNLGIQEMLFRRQQQRLMEEEEKDNSEAFIKDKLRQSDKQVEHKANKDDDADSHFSEEW